MRQAVGGDAMSFAVADCPLWITASKWPSLLTWAATSFAPAIISTSPYYRFGLGQFSPGVPGTGSIAGVQHDFMTLADEPFGGHEAEAGG